MRQHLRLIVRTLIACRYPQLAAADHTFVNLITGEWTMCVNAGIRSLAPAAINAQCRNSSIGFRVLKSGCACGFALKQVNASGPLKIEAGQSRISGCTMLGRTHTALPRVPHEYSHYCDPGSERADCLFCFADDECG